ncbi:MAG: FIST signal transduction protein, partial [Anaerolineales bacterium]
GQQQRSILVALLAGNNVTVRADWHPDFTRDGKATTQKMVEGLRTSILASGNQEKTLLVIADGIQGDGEQLCKHLPKGEYTLGGCLTGSNVRQARTFQIGGTRAGDSGLASALLFGNLKTGIGVSHGWQPVGKYFEITRVEGPWVRTLDRLPASETYARLFGHTSHEWAFPPLNELVRLYPLGLENENLPLQIRSPLQVEVDGSFRMSSPVREGSTGHLMIGSTASCVEAVQRASQQALQALGSARPVLAIVFADIAWKILFETQPGIETAAISAVLGMDIPIAGGYTVGQIFSSNSSNTPELLNQHIEIIVFGATV